MSAIVGRATPTDPGQVVKKSGSADTPHPVRTRTRESPFRRRRESAAAPEGAFVRSRPPLRDTLLRRRSVTPSAAASRRRRPRLAYSRTASRTRRVVVLRPLRMAEFRPLRAPLRALSGLRGRARPGVRW
ncbi:hypothetical protein SSP531S_30600 [Streptomyces spongiicola]|uniref:Uncharacterized protein n=1 Tax=Streptomyces spongiicola TaxID=1690221 RepID=A0A388T0U4_9ACTN|nr:hypothetical protein SSP531S_30600 [Streptomyces spongiicola]